MSATTKTFLNNNAPQCEDVDLNGFKAENNSLITGSGQVLDTGDSQQTHKAVAVFAAGGDFYTDTGAVNASVLSPVGAKTVPPGVFQGMRIRFVPAATNTGVSTVTNSTWGTETIIAADGTPLVGGELVVGQEVEASYDGSDFKLIRASGGNQTKLTLSSTAEVDLVNTDVPLNVGAAAPNSQQHVEFSKTSIQSKSDATTASALAINPFGGDVVIGNSSSDRLSVLSGKVSYANGTVANPATGDNQNFLIDFGNNVGTIFALSYNGSPDLVVKSFVQSGNFRVVLTNAGLSEVFPIDCDPDGAVTLAFGGNGTIQTADPANGGALVNNAATGAGFERALTVSDKIISGELSLFATGGEQGIVTSAGEVFIRAGTAGGSGDPDAGGAQNYAIIFQSANQDTLADLGYFGTTNLGLTNSVLNGHLLLRAEHTAGARTLFDGDPNGATELNHAFSDATVLRTADPSVGGVLINNTLTGPGFERVATISDVQSIGAPGTQVLSSDALIPTSTEVDVPIQFSSLEAGRYRVDGVILAESTSGSAAAILDITVVASNQGAHSISVLKFDSNTSETTHSFYVTTGTTGSAEIIEGGAAAQRPHPLSGALEILSSGGSWDLRFTANASGSFTISAGSWINLVKIA